TGAGKTKLASSTWRQKTGVHTSVHAAKSDKHGKPIFYVRFFVARERQAQSFFNSLLKSTRYRHRHCQAPEILRFTGKTYGTARHVIPWPTSLWGALAALPLGPAGGGPKSLPAILSNRGLEPSP